MSHNKVVLSACSGQWKIHIFSLVTSVQKTDEVYDFSVVSPAAWRNVRDAHARVHQKYVAAAACKSVCIFPYAYCVYIYACVVVVLTWCTCMARTPFRKQTCSRYESPLDIIQRTHAVRIWTNQPPCVRLREPVITTATNRMDKLPEFLNNLMFTYVIVLIDFISSH
jgi:hypothetical protein